MFCWFLFFVCFYSKNSDAWEQVAQRGGCPVLGDIQGQAGQGSEQSDLAPSNSNNSMILPSNIQYCFFQEKLSTKAKNTWPGQLHKLTYLLIYWENLGITLKFNNIYKVLSLRSYVEFLQNLTENTHNHTMFVRFSSPILLFKPPL